MIEFRLAQGSHLAVYGAVNEITLKDGVLHVPEDAPVQLLTLLALLQFKPADNQAITPRIANAMAQITASMIAGKMAAA